MTVIDVRALTIVHTIFKYIEGKLKKRKKQRAQGR